MSIIAVDIDDTLYSFNQLAREVFVEIALETGDKRMQRGAYCAWTEWRSPADVSNVDVWTAVIKRCHSPERISAQLPFPDAAETLYELAEDDYHFHYISNRAPETVDVTENWLIDNEFPYRVSDRITCTTVDKLPLLRDCRYLIDDRPKTLVEFVYDFKWKHRYGSENTVMARKAFGLHMPYNAALTDVPGVKLAPNWKLLRQYLIDQDVLRSIVGIND